MNDGELNRIFGEIRDKIMAKKPNKPAKSVEVLCPCPEWFGAKGDGETDDSKAIQECGDLFNIIRFGNKAYKLSCGVFLDKFSRYTIITDNTKFVMDGDEAKIVIGHSSDTSLFPSQTRISQIKDGSIVVSDVSMFSAGDYICLGNDSYPQDDDNEEFLQIVNVDYANNVLCLDRKPQKTLDISKVYKIDFRRLVHVGKVTFIMPQRLYSDALILNGLIDSFLDYVYVDGCKLSFRKTLGVWGINTFGMVINEKV